ncbi:MAG: CPBP family intramembrane metalloprotease [Alphaproteobacteria bacterium]|nr:CPBP family intramembrane metalloprotease [Alphaproteobacteria bacterium]
MPEEHSNQDNDKDANAFVVVMVGTILLGLVAFGLSFLLHTPLAPQLFLSFDAVFLGVIATLPPVLFLWWFSNTDLPAFAEFRRSQIKFFAEVGFRFTPLRIVLMAIGAGVCEELMFRGVLQSWIDGFAPIITAIILSNIVFGLLHMRTVLYAVIAGGIGVYFGVIYALTDNLVVPMVAHGLYDAVALEYTRRAIVLYHQNSGERA